MGKELRSRLLSGSRRRIAATAPAEPEASNEDRLVGFVDGAASNFYRPCLLGSFWGARYGANRALRAGYGQ